MKHTTASYLTFIVLLSVSTAMNASSKERQLAKENEELRQKLANACSEQKRLAELQRQQDEQTAWEMRGALRARANEQRYQEQMAWNRSHGR